MKFRALVIAAFVLAFGAMLGKILEESGAAHTIAFRMIDLMGLKNIQYALMITGFFVGLPMMYNASFLVLIPLIFTFAVITKLPLLWLALPLAKFSFLFGGVEGIRA